VTGSESTRIAGVDFGTVRIGIALADTEVRIAGPYANYTRRTKELDAAYFARLAAEEQIGRFVVGLPVHLDGNEGQKSTEARAFGKWLGEATGVPSGTTSSSTPRRTSCCACGS
jgi:putative Holliday junction resolvase